MLAVAASSYLALLAVQLAVQTWLVSMLTSMDIAAAQYTDALTQRYHMLSVILAFFMC